ncbi:MAG: DUF2501 domain-containing protein [Candidatus Accumulibacter sp. UW26]|jgi:hypothetical protein
MNARRGRRTAAWILIAALWPLSTAQAQLGDLIKQGESGIGNLGDLGGALSGQSVTSGSIGNVAGLLEFCIKNNFLGGKSGAASVKDSLMGKLPGGSSSSDKGYSNGAKGLLSGSDGSQFDLSGEGMKKQVTKQVCDKVLAQGRSML